PAPSNDISSWEICYSMLQKLKRSLSFKTKSIRSKSADNFFRTTSDNKTELLSDVTIPSAPPPTSRSQARNPLQVDSAGHCFMEHIFKKPTFCDVCNHMIVACGNKVDPVYEALRFGTSLAQKAKRASGSESPHRNSTSDLDNVPEEAVAHSSRQELSRKHSDEGEYPLRYTRQTQKDVLQLNTYVALYSFTPQESQDLEMRPGDRILLADDSNDDWWKGVIEDRIGFFPASFAHQVRTGDQVFRCNRTFIGCKEQGQITLKEGQICVSSEGERSGFIRVASGKKRGYVPCDVLEII
uniref:SH3 and cysteine rich domain n=1 Tax=Myripristis murdjan TaxID=586833 RepID=A0A667WRW7_9TELE